MIDSVVPASGLQVHSQLRSSPRARVLGRLILALSTLASAASAFWLLDGGVPGWAGGISAVGAALCWVEWHSLRTDDRITAVSVDAGGNWALCDGAGWHRCTLERIWISPFGWLSLKGELRSIGHPSLPARPVALSIWSDSVPPPAWRRLRIAASWRMQRQDALLVGASARDPRLEVSP